MTKEANHRFRDDNVNTMIDITVIKKIVRDFYEQLWRNTLAIWKK